MTQQIFRGAFFCILCNMSGKTQRMHTWGTRLTAQWFLTGGVFKTTVALAHNPLAAVLSICLCLLFAFRHGNYFWHLQDRMKGKLRQCVVIRSCVFYPAIMCLTICHWVDSAAVAGVEACVNQNSSTSPCSLLPLLHNFPLGHHGCSQRLLSSSCWIRSVQSFWAPAQLKLSLDHMLDALIMELCVCALHCKCYFSLQRLCLSSSTPSFHPLLSPFSSSFHLTFTHTHVFNGASQLLLHSDGWYSQRASFIQQHLAELRYECLWRSYSSIIVPCQYSSPCLHSHWAVKNILRV